MVYFCCVNGCKKESYRGCGLSFHRIPKDEKMAEKWKDIIPGRVTKTSVVCGLHFEDEDYVHEYSKILKWNAVPSIFPITQSTQETVHILSSRTSESPEEESESEDACSPGPPEKKYKIAEDSEESTHSGCSDSDTSQKRKLEQEEKEDSPVSETPISMRKTIERLKFVSAQRLKKIRALSQQNRSLKIKNKKLKDDIEDLKKLLKEEE